MNGGIYAVRGGRCWISVDVDVNLKSDFIVSVSLFVALLMVSRKKLKKTDDD